MTTVGRLTLVPLVLFAFPQHESQAQQLELSASVGKSVFFEGEPIYTVFRLTNRGSDTVWTPIFQLAPDLLEASLKRSDGSVVPTYRMWVDYAFPQGWRGVPLAPGEATLLLVVLQNRIGDAVLPRWTMFPRKIGVGAYTLVVTFHAAVKGAPTALPDVVANPVRIEVRARTLQEERSFSEVAQLMSQGWDRNGRAGYFQRLMALIRTRLGQDSMDSFASFLVNDAVVTGKALGLAPSSDELAFLREARLAIARKQRFEPAGAMAALALAAEREPLADLAEQLGPSLAQEAVKPRAGMHRASPTQPGRPNE